MKEREALFRDLTFKAELAYRKDVKVFLMQ
jgi:hypothetical protein